jgi:uncharacterized membrane-anchored protein YhcB (DUF1043 family)
MTYAEVFWVSFAISVVVGVVFGSLLCVYQYQKPESSKSNEIEDVETEDEISIEQDPY